MLSLRPGMTKDRDEVIHALIEMQYDRNDMDLQRSCFRVRGDVVEINPAQGGDSLVRVEFFGDEIDRIAEIDPLTGKVNAFVGAYYNFSGIALCCSTRKDSAGLYED